MPPADLAIRDHGHDRPVIPGESQTRLCYIIENGLKLKFNDVMVSLSGGIPGPDQVLLSQHLDPIVEVPGTYNN